MKCDASTYARRSISLGLTVFLFMCGVTAAVRAQTFTVLYAFSDNDDGAGPTGELIRDHQGNLYGTSNKAVFQLDVQGNLHTVRLPGNHFPFPSPSGNRLIRDFAGNLYGSTRYGYNHPPQCKTSGQFGRDYGCGTVFKVDRAGQLTVLYAFNGIPDGAWPAAGLVRDADGNLYGTTLAGGRSSVHCTNGCGTVFKLDATGKETILYSFTGGSDGAFPNSELVADPRGNLYGTTSEGGRGEGTVFRLTPSGKETALYNFIGGTDGAYPNGVAQDGQGNLYGTTSGGGNYEDDCLNLGCGTVFKLSSTGKERVLYRFHSAPDGFGPTAGLIWDVAGNAYGTTYFGGPGCSFGNFSCGTVFQLDNTGRETILHNFVGTDGSTPQAGLIRDNAGNLYGTTSGGGNYDACPLVGCGTVFKLTP